MSDVTRILKSIGDGDPKAADELRKVAAATMESEKPGQTLSATSLVHDACIRLVDVEKAQHWNCRRHFFSAEAMRLILVENARRRHSRKHGGEHRRIDITDANSHDRRHMHFMDAHCGRLLCQLPTGHYDTWHCFSPDGNHFASMESRMGVQVWDLRALQLQLGELGLVPNDDAGLFHSSP